VEYGQFCPVAKALEVLGERWTILIVRELLMGGSRFNELQRGLNQISPTMLTRRLNELSDAGIVIRKKIPGQRGYEYFLTEMGNELLPVVESIGNWGMRWARGKMDDTDLDLELLMLYLKRSIRPDKLPGNETIIRFKFTDIDQFSNWWIVVTDDDTDVCVRDPGKDVDVYFTTDLRTMIEVWMGDTPYKNAVSDGRLKLVGPSALTRNVTSWLSSSFFSGIPPATAIQ
jgi:DNA-binding HxlR family transcriptional regulator